MAAVVVGALVLAVAAFTVLALAAFALNAAQSDRDRRQEERRSARDRATAEDRAREETLRTYFQQMSDLILRHGVPSSRDRGDANTGTLARTLTLVALRWLDGPRKGLVMQFLLEQELITADTAWEDTAQGLQRFSCLPVPAPAAAQRDDRPRLLVNPCDRLKAAPLSLEGADLRDAVMPSALSVFVDGRGPDAAPQRTRAAILDGADLRNADFRGGNLIAVSLADADLRGANFTGATIGGAAFHEKAGGHPGGPPRGSRWTPSAPAGSANGPGDWDRRKGRMRGPFVALASG